MEDKKYHLKLLDCGKKITRFDYLEIDSTNSEAKRRFDALPSECVFIAQKQTAGRGRLGRSFYSPKDTGAYFSLCLKGNWNYDTATAFTSLAAVSVCKAIESLTDLSPQIKWVNDVYVNGKKACGILTETVLGENGVIGVIIGVGINVTTEFFPDGIDAISLGKNELNKDALICAIINEILNEAPFITQYRHIPYYREHSFLTGKAVTYYINGIRHEGVVEDISDTAGLFIKAKDGTLDTLSSGEVTVRVNK